MNKVLIIAYDFPPIGGSGAQRTLKYAKYLPTFGWNPIILTVEKRPDDISYADSSFLNELPNNVKIYRAYVLEPHTIYRFLGGRQQQGSRETNILVVEKDPRSFTGKIKNWLFSLAVPDFKIGWYPGAIRTAAQIFENHDIRLIYSTSPKPTAHIIARHLARKHKRPWVADFRDPWFADYASPLNRPKFLRKTDKSLEKSVLFEATHITVASPGIRNDIIRKHKQLDESKVTIITNGYDEEDFIGLLPKMFRRFTIAYAGIFYKGSYPEPLFRGLTLALGERPGLRQDIKVLFIGISDPLVLELIQKYNLSDVVEHVPYLPHRECLSYLLGSHLLFLNTIGDALTGKLFDYWGTGRPILALVGQKTEIAHMIKRTRTGVVIDPRNSKKIKDFIIHSYSVYKKGTIKQDIRQKALIEQYTRKKLTRRLSDIFDKVI